MGRMKDLLIDSDTDDLEFIAEMQAHTVSSPCIGTSHEQTAYLLMQDGKPVRVYTDRALALYECWICTRGDEKSQRKLENGFLLYCSKGPCADSPGICGFSG